MESNPCAGTSISPPDLNSFEIHHPRLKRFGSTWEMVNDWTNSGHSLNFLSCSSIIIISSNDKYKRYSEKRGS